CRAARRSSSTTDTSGPQTPLGAVVSVHPSLTRCTNERTKFAMTEREPEAGKSTEPASAASPAAGAHPAILIVDDEDSSRRLVKAILEAAGYRVTAASCGEEALAAAESTSYGAIVSDLNMPGMG